MLVLTSSSHISDLQRYGYQESILNRYIEEKQFTGQHADIEEEQFIDEHAEIEEEQLSGKQAEVQEGQLIDKHAEIFIIMSL